jgi:hypothetical protein
MTHEFTSTRFMSSLVGASTLRKIRQTEKFISLSPSLSLPHSLSLTLWGGQLPMESWDMTRLGFSDLLWNGLPSAPRSWSWPLSEAVGGGGCSNTNLRERGRESV